MDSLLETLRFYNRLDKQHPNEITDLVDAVHKIQSLLALRVIRRNYPEYWIIKK